MPAESATAPPTQAIAMMSCWNVCIHITMNAAELMRRGVEKSFIAAVFIDYYRLQPFGFVMSQARNGDYISGRLRSVNDVEMIESEHTAQGIGAHGHLLNLAERHSLY